MLYNKMKFNIYTLGCKVNSYDSEEISENMQNHGFFLSKTGDEDVFIVNSCTVTAESDRKTRQLVRRLRRSNVNAIIVLTGCMPQAFPNLGEELLEADIVVGNHDNDKIPQYIDEFLRDRKRIFRVIPHIRNEKYSGGIIKNFEEHTRAFIKIQDGCDRFCSYCAIPYARGRSRSKPLEIVQNELDTIAKAGYKEVVFVGINLSFYGADFGLTLASAVKSAENTDGIERIRLGSLEPDHIDESLLMELSECRKFCPQFHISLQSGSDKILRKMNRHYTADEYAVLVENIRIIFPDAAITTDIICGFPGETEDDFAETVSFAQKIGFDKTHIFPYSRRPGTPADKLPEQISKQIKEERCRNLAIVCEKSRLDFMQKMVGKTVNVLFEVPSDGIQRGYGENYLPVNVISDEILTGKILPVKIISVQNDGLCGILV